MDKKKTSDKLDETQKTPLDGMLASLVWYYLKLNCEPLAKQFLDTAKPPLLMTKSPNLREILQFFLQRTGQSVSVSRRLKEYDETDVNQPEKLWAVHQTMQYIQLGVGGKSNNFVYWAQENSIGKQNFRKQKTIHPEPTLQKKKSAVANRNQKIQTVSSPPTKAMKKIEPTKTSTPIKVKKNVLQKSKLTSKKKSALIKDMIQKKELVSVKNKLPKVKKCKKN